MSISTPSRWSSVFVLMLALGLACGGPVNERSTVPSNTEAISALNVAEATRVLHRLEPGSAERNALRDRLLDFRREEGASLLEGEDFDGLVRHFATMIDLYTPADFEGDGLAPLLPFAARIAALGAPRGDEARVLAARRTQLASSAPSDDARAEYEEIDRWSQQARAGFDNAMERLSTLIAVWDEHARLSPAADVLARLADLHIARRDAVLHMAAEGGALRMAMRGLPEQVARVAPLDVAAVYLVHGDLQQAIERVQDMGEGPTERQLLRVMRAALESDGADALVELAEAYREARPRVAVGTCRLGVRRFPEDARFSACLARISTAMGDMEAAIAWYEIAIDGAPGERRLYDEALAHVDEMLERSVNDTEATRKLARYARELLRARQTRFPNAAPPVAEARIELLLGISEMHAGHVSEARGHLEASVQGTPTARNHEQLGLLQERLGEYDAAAESYRAALDLAESETQRALLQGRLGDAFAGAGNSAQARRLYEQSLGLWDRVLGQLRGRPEAASFLAETQLRRGIVLGKLERADESQAAFRAALIASPQAQGTYATILSFLVTAAPDAEFAAEIFQAAKRQTTLTGEWRVYFALWVRAIAARAGVDPNDDVNETLAQATGASGWSGQLARFGAGELSAEGLIAAAVGPGQQTEAFFYAGALSADGAVLARALEGRMVDFYEYVMAQRLLSLE